VKFRDRTPPVLGFRIGWTRMREGFDACIETIDADRDSLGVRRCGRERDTT
jgi:hypothetical protein